MIYSGLAASKNNAQIPLFYNGKPMHSKYSPEKEGEVFASYFKEGFIITAGLGGGFHIKALLQKFNQSFIICVEADKESLDFCLSLNENKLLLENKNIIFTTPDFLEEEIIKNYIPPLYENFTLEFQRAWLTNNEDAAKKIQLAAKSALEKVSADFSVQSHFGKQWQRNLLLNLKNFSKNPYVKTDLSKTALICAAGPGLENSLSFIKKQRASYFIICADTSYGTLLESSIFPDAVVSVDSQHVSCQHFYHFNKSKTLFVFDITSSPDAVRKAGENGNDIFFIKSAHPLSRLLCRNTDIPFINTGSGTVTIGCVDFARFLGFQKIQITGADFAYTNGKPYAKGTYLEKQYLSRNNRFKTEEELYCTLMFRTETERIGNDESICLFKYSMPAKNSFTTQILNRYRLSLDKYLADSNFDEKERNVFFTAQSGKNPAEEKSQLNKTEKTFSYKKSVEDFCNKIALVMDSKDFILTQETVSLLPFACYLKRNSATSRLGNIELIKLAYSNFRRYN